MKLITTKVFENRIDKIKDFNNYDNDWNTTEECSKQGLWTPVDLILKEYYNNGGGSAKGFLGLSKKSCEECYEYIKENQEHLKKTDRYNKNGFNNFGFPLWSEYKVY